MSCTISISVGIIQHIDFFWHRYRRGWDYIEEVGLIMAGSLVPASKAVELSTDGGQTFEHLAGIPWVRLHIHSQLSVAGYPAA